VCGEVNVLLLSRYGRLGASSRVRYYQFLPQLEASGIQTTVSALLDDLYLQRLYSGQRFGWTRILFSYARRIRALLSVRRYDIVWIEKELLPWMPALGERLLYSLRIPYVVDYDDAVFHSYDLHPRSIVRAALGTKIDEVMRSSALVTAGNDYLADRARSAGARRVEVVPTVVDTDVYRPGSQRSGPVTIGWIGSPSTAKYLRTVAGALAEVCRDGAARVVVVGAPDPGLGSVPLEVRAWAEHREVSDIQSFDIGIMPLEDGPWERGKCGYKLIQYMACGLPVVGSPVGVNRSIVRHGTNGFLASSPEEWVRFLSQLRDDAKLRSRMGQHGRADVEAGYSVRSVGPRLLDYFRDLHDPAI
jgi:glycosyltransferase involved in cell wall biosynthesis